MTNRYSIFPVGATLILAAVMIPTGVNALTFSPARIESSVYPGVPHTEELTLFNETSESVSVVLDPVLLDIIDASQGTATFLLDSAKTADISWLQANPAQFVLESGEKRTVEISMIAPDSSSGSLIGGIATTFHPVRSGGKGDILTEGVTGPFVLTEVLSVNNNKSGYIESFDTADSSRLTSGLPVKLKVSFANDGTVHTKPTGKIEVSSLTGRVVSTIPVNPAGQTILPGTKRDFELIWDSATEERTSNFEITNAKPLIGPMRLKLTMNYDEKQLESSITMWIIPKKTIVFLVIIIIGIAAIRRRLYRV